QAFCWLEWGSSSGVRVSMFPSKAPAKLKDDDGIAKPDVKDIRRELRFLMGEAHQEAALHVEGSVKGLGALCRQSQAQPVVWRVRHLRPTVVEIFGAVGGVKHIFVGNR